MLTKFTVSNFKGFNNDFVFDLKDVNAYAFNTECIKKGVVNNVIIYGKNGVGKSNLGFALFDIIGNLTDKAFMDIPYVYYLNAINKSEVATFRYEFLIEGHEIVYEYGKRNLNTLEFERFLIDNNELASIEQSVSFEATIRFKGAETLNNNLTNTNLSLLKYIKLNSVLEDNIENKLFLAFYKFVEGMLFFRSLQGNMFLGIERDGGEIDADIIQKGNVDDLEKFLNKAGVECKLKVVNERNKEVIAFDFEGEELLTNRAASSGTKALMLFYYWLQRLREENRITFLFIDEFDAFYHHELSALIVEELKNNGVQFVLTTHNTSIISNDILRPDCYFLMKKDTIKSLSRCTEKELREAHNLEKMYKAGSFNVE